MPDQNRTESGPRLSERPVISGLMALVAVAVVIGLIGGVAALFGSRALGLNGDSTVANDDASSDTSLYLPEPTITSEAVENADALPTNEATTQETAEAPDDGISLSAGQTSVSPMGQIDLTGTYPTGEGAVLQVQRLDGETWVDFPVTAPVSNQTFATYVETGRTGENTFRVIDTDNEVISNEVVVTVG